MRHLRARLYQQFDPAVWPGEGLSPVNRAVLGIVLISILAAVLESEPTIRAAFPPVFAGLNVLFAVLFAVEYAVRLWAMSENAAYAGARGKLRYALTPASLIDLVATALLWVDVIFGIPGVYGVLLRLVRVLRALTLMRRSRWATAIRLLRDAIRDRALELTLSFGFAGVILLVAATLLFAVEKSVQPDAFGSIPRAMWWAMATLTTVGYGDVYPVTGIGRLCASVVAITSIAIVAMPTGIMAAAFSDAFRNLREEQARQRKDAPPAPRSTRPG